MEHITARPSRPGFTLIELLIVVAIIGILSLITVVAVASARKDARDTKRLADMGQINKALRIYREVNSSYPGPVGSYGEGGASEGCGGWDTTSFDIDADGITMLDTLVTDKLISGMPVDPLNGTTCNSYNYRYYRFNQGAYGCDSSRGPFYVLAVRDMEGSSGAHENSPGFSCPSRDFQSEFEWVIGGYTN